MKDILNRQADCIEYVLRTHGINGTIESGKLSPRLAHFNLSLPEGVRAAQVATLLPELADELGVVACRLAPAADGLYLEVPRPDPVPVRLLPIVQRVADVVPPATTTLGLDGNGVPLLLRLHSPDVDPVLVTGSRGSGKSSLMGTMALSLALHNSPERLKLLLVDCSGEGSAFGGLEDLPHNACPVGYGPVEALASLRWALRVLARRSHTWGDDELFFDDAEEGNRQPAPPKGDDATLVIMLDGADALWDTGNRRLDAEGADAVARIIAAGNRHGIHLVASVEDADLAYRVSADWRARIAGLALSAEDARLMTGMKGSGAQHLLGSGDFLVALNAELVRFQAGAASQGEMRKAVSLINAAAIAYNAPQNNEAPPPFMTRPRPERPSMEPPIPLRRSRMEQELG
jgi:DNA segregation ATPase FtsK/SpoIIIE-like protein